jgi:PAS domain S-box-containing protein
VSRLNIKPTGREQPFYDDEIIVSKTDVHGKILYVNDIFARVSLYDRSELIGAPHSLIRHPEMPRAIFQLLWERIPQAHEVFAYIVNLCSNGDHYWVLAHVTATLDATGKTVGYHSTRRTARPEALEQIRPLYAQLRAVEAEHERKPEAAAAGAAALHAFLADREQSYDEFVWSL